MWWQAAGDWSAKAVDQFLGQDAAHKANRTNIMLARENRDWMEMMSNTSVRRHMADLKAAGVNPLFGLVGGASASTPTSQPARVEPTYRAGNPARVSETMLAISTAKELEARARLTNAEAAIREAHIPYSASNALATSDKLQEEVVRLGQEVEKADIEIERGRLDMAQFVKMAPLLQRAQELANQASSLGMSRKDTEAKIADMFGIAADHVREFYGLLNELGHYLGDKSRDVREAIQEAPRHVLERLQKLLRSK